MSDIRDELLAANPHAFDMVRNGGTHDHGFVTAVPGHSHGIAPLVVGHSHAHAHTITDPGHSHGISVSPAERAQALLDANGGALDTLIGLIERGPLWDGDVPSKAGREALFEQGLAARVIVDGEDGYTAATYAGAAAFKQRYGGATIRQAMQARKTARNASRAAAPNIRYAVMVGDLCAAYVIGPLGREGNEVRLTVDGFESTALVGRLVADPAPTVAAQTFERDGEVCDAKTHRSIGGTGARGHKGDLGRVVGGA
ncbi:hypothetical protein [Paraburkholderia sp. C35]|uniref:hypothetical protein n=1 Tax=Paraburkholderia sp. C35 TaxID=2126993 RepID=UPI000D68E6A6|nr:hypothetical protein [Paraburkholderia sp. C35]